MSTKAFDSALDFMPETKVRQGGNGGFRSTVALLIEALSTGRQAEAEYRRQIARGVDPATAASEAFNRYKSA